MRIGNLRHRITLQKRTISTNANGLELDAWEDLYTCWASVNGLSGNELWAAKAIQAENTVTFTLRHCKKLSELSSTGFRIVFQNAIYNITHIDFVRYQHQQIKIKGTTISPGGQL